MIKLDGDWDVVAFHPDGVKDPAMLFDRGTQISSHRLERWGSAGDCASGPLE
jgi:hypothetical protein